MAKKLKEEVKDSKSDLKKDLKTLLKTKTPGIFEREPAPAFAEGNLDKLVEAIDSLYA